MATKKERSNKPASRPRSKRPEASQSQPEIPVETGEIAAVEVAEAQLQEAATRKVSSQSAVFIDGLADKAAQGNAAAAKLLIELMRGKKQPESKPGQGRLDFLRFLVDQWTNEREWQDPDKSEPKTAAGNN